MRLFSRLNFPNKNLGKPVVSAFISQSLGSAEQPTEKIKTEKVTTMLRMKRLKGRKL